jgi:predicted enzyme related to lactoylglutathione lyase
MSGNLLLSHPRFREAAGYYEKVFGLELLEETENEVGLKAGDDLILYVEGGESGFVFEFNVPNIEVARAELEEAGCTTLVWEGKGGRCYMQDPFGFVFNLWEKAD